jgi:hypothetical protein
MSCDGPECYFSTCPRGICLERATRIELAFSAWEADVLPLNYARG